MRKRNSGWKPNWPVFIRTFVSIRMVGWRPQLVVIDKYERAVRWVVRVLAGLAVVSSIFVFPAWYYALAFSIAVFLVQQFFERTMYVYTTMYVQPMPTFEVKTAEWYAMAYAFAEPPSANRPNCIGPVFMTRGYAVDVFDLIRSWNYGEDIDEGENICVSLIFEGNGNYTVYLYPNMRRPTTTAFFDEGDALRSGPMQGREHQKLVVMMTFCKVFPISAGSLVRRFVDEVERDPRRPYFLQAFLNNGGSIEILYDVKPMLMSRITIRNRADLRPGDMEYNFRGQGTTPIAL